MNKEILVGGNVNNEIEKVENTVHRSTTWNSNIHAFLQFMESYKFSGIPRFIGIDEMNREILSYLEGESPGNRFPNCDTYIWSDVNIKKVGGFLRAYHDQSEAYVNIAFKNQWVSPVFSKEECEVICHNDFAPYNFVYQEGIFTGIIDFDMAYPAPRIWDIAYALYTCIPLTSYQPVGHGKTKKYEKQDASIRNQRIRLFFEAYQMKRPDDLFIWVERRLQELCNYIEIEANKGVVSFQNMVERKEIEYYQKEISFIKENSKDW